MDNASAEIKVNVSDKVNDIKDVGAAIQVEGLRPTKNLANCTNVEFLVQTNRIRKQVAEWLSITNVLKIRKHRATLIEITDNMSAEEKAKAEAENEKRVNAQLKQNLSDMIDACLETNAEKTVELLGLMCFLTPEEAKNEKPFFLIRNFLDMFNDKDVMGFFSSLMQSDLMSILLSAKE